jgi:hypothetical protein
VRFLVLLASVLLLSLGAGAIRAKNPSNYVHSLEVILNNYPVSELSPIAVEIESKKI